MSSPGFRGQGGIHVGHDALQGTNAVHRHQGPLFFSSIDEMTGDGQRGEVEDDLVEYGDDPGRLVKKMDGAWEFQIIVGKPLGGKSPSRGEGEMRSVEGEREGEVYGGGWVRRN